MNIQEGIFWLILTVFNEARDQVPVGQKNVTKVIINRADKNNWPISNVVFARKQFSCYNEGVLKALTTVAKEIPIIVDVTRNVNNAIDDWLEGDTLNGATHYYSPKAMIPPGRVPSWVKNMTFIGKYGDQLFYRED